MPWRWHARARLLAAAAVYNVDLDLETDVDLETGLARGYSVSHVLGSLRLAQLTPGLPFFPDDLMSLCVGFGLHHEHQEQHEHHGDLELDVYQEPRRWLDAAEQVAAGLR